MRPVTKYAKSGELHIAYQVVGRGAIDLVWAPGYISHVEYAWEHPPYANFINRLATFSRVIRFDKRGTGLSDRSVAVPTLEDRMDDVRAVMDAVGCERAALFGENDGGPMCMLFAATYPARTHSLALYATFARHVAAPDYPWPLPREERERNVRRIVEKWGDPQALNFMAPSLRGDSQFQQWRATDLRLGASPGAALGLFMMNSEFRNRRSSYTGRVTACGRSMRDDGSPVRFRALASSSSLALTTCRTWAIPRLWSASSKSSLPGCVTTQSRTAS